MGKMVGFGEIMVRLESPGYHKIIQSNEFNVSYAGAEASVSVFLSRMGLKTQYVTKLPKNEVADTAMSRLRMHGVGLDHLAWGGDRIGVYYIERGASQRPSKVVYDRKYSSVSQASRDDFDWEAIFDGASWFHFTGITAALSPQMPEICLDALKVAKKKGVTVSCDLNYRKNLWSEEKAKEVMTTLMPYVDVLIGNEEDAEKTLGVAPRDTDVTAGTLSYEAYTDVARQISERFGTKHIAFTLRSSISASDNKWAGMLYTSGTGYFSKEYLIHIVDRVGGGDSFAAGMIYSLKEGYEPQRAIEFAVAASTLKHTLEQDFNLNSKEDIELLMSGDGSGRVQR
jgi:2-dehydro-3-deoxygluconokinase